MNNILVTIAIPTFNGAKYLAHTINSVLSQEKLTADDLFEILISDNGSTDETRQIIEYYELKYPNLIRAIFKSTNTGYDRNVACLFTEAKGDYVWLLGDDDYLAPGALHKFFTTLKNNLNIRYSIFLFSASFLDIETDVKSWTPRFDVDLIFENGNNFLKATMWATAPLASLCVRRKDWLDEDLQSYFGTNWIHVGALIKILRHTGNSSYVFCDEMVTFRTSNPRWATNFGGQIQSGLSHLQVVSDINSLGYSSDVYEMFVKDRYESNFRDLISMAPPPTHATIFTCKNYVSIFLAISDILVAAFANLIRPQSDG